MAGAEFWLLLTVSGHEYVILAEWSRLVQELNRGAWVEASRTQEPFNPVYKVDGSKVEAVRKL